MGFREVRSEPEPLFDDCRMRCTYYKMIPVIVTLHITFQVISYHTKSYKQLPFLGVERRDARVF